MNVKFTDGYSLSEKEARSLVDQIVMDSMVSNVDIERCKGNAVVVEKKNMLEQAAHTLLGKCYIEPQYYVKYQWNEGYENVVEITSYGTYSPAEKYRIRLRVLVFDVRKLLSSEE